MPSAKDRTHKHFQLDAVMLKRATSIASKAETEALDRALDFAARTGIRVVTLNERDFRQLAEFREFNGNWPLRSARPALKKVQRHSPVKFP